MGGIIDSFLGTGGEGEQAAGAADPFFKEAIAELKRQFEVTQQNVSPFIEAGTGALPGVTQGTTAGGLDERLRQIFDTDIFGSLVEERQRGVQGQLAAGGLTRSGTALQEAARVPTDIGLMLENLLTGRGTNLATSGQNAALGLGGIGGQASGAIANTLISQGQNRASGILTDAQARASGVGNLFSLGQLGLKAGDIGGFSDPRLKTNIEKIATLGDLTVFQWEWIEGAKGTLIEKCMTVGFMADEVKEKYPDYVEEFCGLQVIDYPGLLDELEAA